MSVGASFAPTNAPTISPPSESTPTTKPRRNPFTARRAIRPIAMRSAMPISQRSRPWRPHLPAALAAAGRASAGFGGLLQPVEHERPCLLEMASLRAVVVAHPTAHVRLLERDAGSVTVDRVERDVDDVVVLGPVGVPGKRAPVRIGELARRADGEDLALVLEPLAVPFAV